MHKNTDTLYPKTISPEEAIEKYAQSPVDIAIIGAGPAGYSAAINAINQGRSAVILSGDYKSSYLYKASVVNNLPGLPGKSGAELLELFRSHALSMGAVEIRTQALLIMPFPTDDDSSLFQIAYGNNMMLAKTCILATGVSAFTPFPGEDLFLGRGVSYCATCDGMLYRGKSIAVIAKASDAIDEAIHLVKIGCRVTLFAAAGDLKKWSEMIPDGTFEQVIAASKFSIEGEGAVTGVMADGTSYPVEGIFILRSSIAPDSLVPGIELKDGYIGISRDQSTSIPGIYAAGDCTGKPLQIAKSLGEGLIAAISADSFLSSAKPK